jgi:hypothetical protein
VTPARLIGAVAALVVCAWFAVALVQTRDTDRASAIVSAPGTLTPAAAARAAGLLHDAGTLNPGVDTDLLRAALAVREGQPARARSILAGVLAQEPMNIQAWAALARASAGDPSTFKAALRHVRALAPAVPAS